MVTFLVTLNNAEARKPLSLQCFFDLYFGFNSRHQLFFIPGSYTQYYRTVKIKENQPSYLSTIGFLLLS